jgi:D-ribose pyranase
MKKDGILNSELAKIVDDLGHTDKVCIGDLGLPVPSGIKKIDLALRYGSPKFQEVLDEYLANVVVEKVYLASEMKEKNPQQLGAVLGKLPENVEVVFISHEELKEMEKDVKAVVRTGEATPFSNIVLQSGVTI